MLQPTMTWAEDRATQRCDPSADSGASSDRRTARGQMCRGPFSVKPSDADGKNALNLRGTMPRNLRHDVLPQFANANRLKFQFPVNQDTPYQHTPR